MKQLSFIYTASGIECDQLQAIEQRLVPEIQRIEQEFDAGYESPYAFMDLPFDEQTVHEVLRCAHEKLHLDPTVLVVIGIGGSHLGAQAVHEAFKGLLY